jgi:hypothetical protein
VLNLLVYCYTTNYFGWYTPKQDTNQLSRRSLNAQCLLNNELQVGRHSGQEHRSPGPPSGNWGMLLDFLVHQSLAKLYSGSGVYHDSSQILSPLICDKHRSKHNISDRWQYTVDELINMLHVTMHKQGGPRNVYTFQHTNYLFKYFIGLSSVQLEYVHR